MEKKRCTIEHIVFSNPENGYSVMQVNEVGTIGFITIVGTFQGVGVGSTIVIEGDWTTNKKFGRQFAVTSWREELPSTVKGIENYLASGLIKGIGAKYAKRIVKKFGIDTLKVLDENPERLLEVDGVGKGRMERIMESWHEQNAIRDVMVFLQGHGVSTAYAVKIYKHYGNESIAKVKENPYALADDVFGIGFKIADAIAKNLGVGHDDLRRCKAGVIYVLGQLAQDGHCYAERTQLTKACVELLEVGESSIVEAFNNLAFEQNIIEDEDDIYLPMYYYAEKGVGNKIRRLMKKNVNLLEGFDLVSINDEDSKIEYDEIQLDAIKEALRSKVMVLTGGPGTGKTTTVLGIIAAFELLKKKVLCAAPTGRAAKRMAEATGKEAKTIHRLLMYNPDSGFGFNEKTPLDGDVLIVDESSMIDILLMNSLLKAVPKRMRVVFVGDIDQLPSVGAGNVLRDIIDSGVVPVVRLTRIFRQAMSSRIVTNAHKVNQGIYPDTSNGKDTDFFFVKQDDAQQAANTVVDIVSRRIPKAYGYNTDDIQVLVPMKNGAAGAVNLNIALQETINPHGEFIQSGQYKFRVGDKVMQIRNNYDKNVFNGDVGVIKAIDTEERTITVLYDTPVVYENNFTEITLAYACTIHKSQGSEYPVVVIPLLMSHYIMLQRNLVYTGITRAKKICIMVGDPRALSMAVKNMPVLNRNTKLKERLNNAK